MKAPKEAYYTLETVLFKSLEMNEVKKGKPLPVGTTRNWGGKDYLKTNAGWIPKGKTTPKGEAPTQPKESKKPEGAKIREGMKPQTEEAKAEKSVEKGCGKNIKKNVPMTTGILQVEEVKPVEKTNKKLMAYKTLEQVLAKALEYVEKGQSLPIGAKRVWGNKTYIKTEKGWNYKA